MHHNCRYSAEIQLSLGCCQYLLLQDRQVIIKFSSGWLSRSQDCWKLLSRRVYGESSEADTDAIKHALPRLRAKVAAFDLADVWNADETGIY